MGIPRRFLVPTDLSRPAEAALDVALDLAAQTDGYVVLLHVCQPPRHVLPDALTHEIRRFMDGARAHAGAVLDRVVAERRPRGVPIDVAIQSGEPWQRIAGTARELDVDMVVMATRGPEGAPRPRLGSVTERVVRTASCAVLTIPG